VAKILDDGQRRRTQAFTELVSHFLFFDRFGRPGKGNDKGKVEGLVKFSRANFLTPVPHAPTLDALNARLAGLCRARQKERAGRNEQTIGERLVADTAALRELPAERFEACRKQATKVSSQALVRYRTNDYSVSTAYGFRDVLVKGFVDEVVIFCDGALIARHARSYSKDDFVFDPRHYLALLEQKPGALDQAAPLQGWALPETLADLRRLMEAHGAAGQARVHPCLAADRRLFRDRRHRRGAGGDPSRRHRLRRGEAARDRESGEGPRALISRPIPICRRRTPPRVLVTHHLRQLKLPTILREYEKVAQDAAREGQDHVRYLLRLVEPELIDRERRIIERRIRAARFPAVKSFDTFDFVAIPSLNKPLVLELAAANMSSRARTSSRSATAARARLTPVWRSGSPHASGASPSPSRRRRGS